MAHCRAPRIARTPFQKVTTPQVLQQRLLAEYRTLRFAPVTGELSFDADYGAVQRLGISAAGKDALEVGYAPVSSALFDCCYDTLTPLIEEWAGCALVRSFGYGIRSYGRGSVLHLHRDRIDTHVISCIIHVDDRSERPWPLDFVDHDGTHHQVTFGTGESLFYESLCPHARLTPFAGDYYRNMYVHWRPANWEFEPYRDMRSKYASLEECLAEWAA